MEMQKFDLPTEEFRTLGYKVIDMIADYYDDIHSVDVFPSIKSSELANLFDERVPKNGIDPEKVIDAWTEKILPHATHLGSPRYFGFVNGSGTMMCTLAEALANSVNMNVGAWKPAPAATEIERQTISWLAEMIGYPKDCGGLMVSGGTMADFTAIFTAFRSQAPFDSTDHGLQGEKPNGRFLIYMSDHEGHIAILRAAEMCNLGRNAIRRVPCHDDFTMDVTALNRMIEEDRGNGDIPFCVVGQAGSINVGAIDPLEEIGNLCQSKGLWFHVDGACGAFGAMIPTKQHLYKGIELADSIALDPHKWLNISYECGGVLVKDPENLRKAFSMSASYLRGTLPTEYTGLDYLEFGPQMSRGFKALKLWMSIKQYGIEGYRKMLSQTIECAEYLHELVTRSSEFEVLHKPQLYIYSFRYVPQDILEEPSLGNQDNMTNRYLDRLNQEIADAIQLGGTAFIMTSKIRGRVVLRMSICSHRTRKEDIKMVFLKLSELGGKLDDRIRDMFLVES